MEKHADITEILPVHALTSCDILACCYMHDAGKEVALKVLRGGSHLLVLLRLVDAPMDRSSNRLMRSCHHAIDNV
jgi:hypothetical protein